MCEYALARAVQNPAVWADFFIQRIDSLADTIKRTAEARHVPVVAAVVAKCRAREVQRWVEVLEELEAKRVLHSVATELLPTLVSHLPLILRQQHDKTAVAAAIERYVTPGNLQLLRVLQDRFHLVAGSQSVLTFWCLQNSLRQLTVPPYVSAGPLPGEIAALVKTLGKEEMEPLLREVKKNCHPLDAQAAVLKAMEAAGYTQAVASRTLVEQKLALLPLLQEYSLQQQVFECMSEATLTQTLLDSLQGADASSIDWTQLFSSAQLFALGRAALSQTVQWALNRGMEEALRTVRALIDARLPPTGLAEVYSGCTGALTQQKDTLFAARLGRLLEEKMSEYMTVSDRNLVASLNLAVAIEISELVTQGHADMAAARCLAYEGLPQEADGEGELRRFLEARTGLPFARDALEKLGKEKGWRSYLKMFGR